jgi:hypothetical protein
VLAEAVAGISRDANKKVMKHPKNALGTYDLPEPRNTYGIDTTIDVLEGQNKYYERWVFSGQDSLYQAFRRAINNYQSGYQIPQPPLPPPRFEVKSGGDKITLSWVASPDEGKTHFDGYSIYRAEGRTDTTFDKIFSCNASNLVHSYEDKTPRRGFSYYYYIVSKSDGIDNHGSPRQSSYMIGSGSKNVAQGGQLPNGFPSGPYLNIPVNEPLMSSKFYTMTNRGAFLMRPAGRSLSDIRVVPNPYNIKARQLQFGQSAPDRLAFYGLPNYCIIKIYTETGDLIETINHTNSSGDELWHSLTSSKQLVASGLYIAYFEVTQDISDIQTGELIYKKGDNIFRKFIIIR